MKRNKQILKAARRAKTRPDWEKRQAEMRAAAATAAREAQPFNQIQVKQ